MREIVVLLVSLNNLLSLLVQLQQQRSGAPGSHVLIVLALQGILVHLQRRAQVARACFCLEWLDDFAVESIDDAEDDKSLEEHGCSVIVVCLKRNNAKSCRELSSKQSVIDWECLRSNRGEDVGGLACTSLSVPTSDGTFSVCV